MIDITSLTGVGDGHAMLRAHCAGRSYREIGREFGCSHEHARQQVQRAETLLVNDIETSLYLAQRYEQLGRASEAQWPGLLVPRAPGLDAWRAGLALLEHVVARLRARGVDVLVKTKAVATGTAFFMTLEATR